MANLTVLAVWSVLWSSQSRVALASTICLLPFCSVSLSRLWCRGSRSDRNACYDKVDWMALYPAAVQDLKHVLSSWCHSRHNSGRSDVGFIRKHPANGNQPGFIVRWLYAMCNSMKVRAVCCTTRRTGPIPGASERSRQKCIIRCQFRFWGWVNPPPPRPIQRGWSYLACTRHKVITIVIA